MSTTRLTHRIQAAFVATVMVGTLLLAAPGVVLAAAAMSATADIPTSASPVTVGDTAVASDLVIANSSSTAGNIVITSGSITLYPSCGGGASGGGCATPDAGVFALSATGTGAGACVGVTFTIGAPDGNGKVVFTQGSTVSIAQLTSCTINFTVNVLKSPTIDADGGLAGVQTLQSAAAAGFLGTLPASGSGSGETTVTKISPTLPTTPSAGGAIGTVLNDSATVTGGSSPTGSIVFNLYGPNDLTCANAAIHTQTVALTAGSATTTPGFTTTAAGTYEWTASYAGDANNNAASSACGAEAVVITNPSIAITKLPATQTIASGGTATWTIVVTNTGDVTLTNVTVADPLAPNCVSSTIGTLAPAASSTAYTCTLSGVTAGFTNIATATGTPPTGPNVTASASAVVIVQTSTGAILPTNTECSDFVNNTTPALAGIFYTDSGGKIGQNINPGVFFYYTYVTTTTPNQGVTTSQHATNGAPLFSLNNGHVWVYTSTCVLVANLTQPGQTVRYKFANPGTYVFRIQYSTKSIAGLTAPSPAGSIYTFDINGVDNASVPLIKK